MKRVIAMKEEKEGLNAYLLVIILSLILYFGLVMQDLKSQR
ncbi:hypothetical protein VTU32_05485 [Thermoanaerobacter sp. CM-CNRG TB177]|nr:hypothetical protein [Thermoanaerobacter sp. CM-CNRG TB177]